MNSTKGVIRIIKKADNPNGYDEFYYFTDVTIDNNGHLIARNTGNIWDAMKFVYNSLDENETKKIFSLIEFIKMCFKSKKRYQIDFIPITLEYNVDFF